MVGHEAKPLEPLVQGLVVANQFFSSEAYANPEHTPSYKNV